MRIKVMTQEEKAWFKVAYDNNLIFAYGPHEFRIGSTIETDDYYMSHGATIPPTSLLARGFRHTGGFNPGIRYEVRKACGAFIFHHKASVTACPLPEDSYAQ